ncbi:MAG: hypothetical protein RL065_2186 [Bacteroidota bacterium]
MIRKILLITCLSVSAFFANAQSVSYKTILDDPKSVPNLRTSIDPFYADMYQGEPHIGWGFRGEFKFLKLFIANIDYRKAYLDMTYDGNINDGARPDYTATDFGLNKANWLEVGGGLVFADWTKAKNLKVVLSSSTSYSGNYKTTHTKYIMVPGHLRHIANIRGGFIRNSTAVELNDETKGYCLNVKDNKDTLKFGFAPWTATTSTYATTVTTMLNQFGFYAGISYKTITNLKIDADGYRKKGNRVTWDLYADLITMPRMHFVDVMNATGSKTYSFQSEKLSKMGWRVGVLAYNQSKVGLSFKSEFGKMPNYATTQKGILGNQFYLMLTMGIGFQQLIKL